jgi:hypothetical protein
VPAVLGLNGHIVDLTDLPTLRGIEIAHADLLVEHQLAHVDLHEITTSRRVVTQTIAGYLYDRGAAAVKFASKLDGQDCFALFESRGTVNSAGEISSLTDPDPRHC